jgi:hypothetical protein
MRKRKYFLEYSFSLNRKDEVAKYAKNLYIYNLKKIKTLAKVKHPES